MDWDSVDVRSLDPSCEGRRWRVGQRYARERKARGWNQQEAAERAGVSQPTLSRLEQGKEVEEESWRAVDGLYGLPDPHPSAPLDPVRRMEFFRTAHAELAEAATQPRSGTFGRGEV
jgi:hypothetical protein